MDCSPPGSSVHVILQARILEWVAISFSRGSSQPRDQTQVTHIASRLLLTKPPGKPLVREKDLQIFSQMQYWNSCFRENPGRRNNNQVIPNSNCQNKTDCTILIQIGSNGQVRTTQVLIYYHAEDKSWTKCCKKCKFARIALSLKYPSPWWNKI